MNRVEAQTWMYEVYQAGYLDSERMFQAMQMGDLKGFRKGMARLIETMQAKLDNSTPGKKRPEQCQYCRHWIRETCRPTFPKQNLRTGAADGCREFSRRKF